MLWHCEIRVADGQADVAARDVERDLPWLGLEHIAPVRTSRIYLLEGDLDRAAAELLARELLTDPVVQTFTVTPWSDAPPDEDACVTVSRKAGVMDPVEESVRRGAARLGLSVDRVRAGTCYRFGGDASEAAVRRVAERVLANPVVDEITIGQCALSPGREAEPARPRRVEIPLGDDDALMTLSREGGLSLNLEEMQALRTHYEGLGRSPTDVELETFAQTWSEHCKHKTFGALIDFDGTTVDDLLGSTVFRATRELDRDFCVSVFKDNAGIVRFDDDYHLCFKVETHNHPSAIEPYGGAGTGLGGVIRDVLGTGLGGKPVANVDVFCVGRPDAKSSELPAGTLHPLRILKGVVQGVRDYGNRMGIPTVSGAVLFDERYTGNPLVYAGTVGLVPVDRTEKKARAGDKIVIMGGRTGRDGIHGATFSSRELHEESEQLDGTAVQIGNAITEKRMMDVLLQARDRGLYTDVTDCGAGGYSSAVGEMGEELGAKVELAEAPLKYPGLEAREIWISEAQERMVIAVPPEHLDEVLSLCESEDVESCVLGEFTGSGRLEITHHGEPVADMEMAFLHDGVPRPRLKATWSPPAEDDLSDVAWMTPGEALRAVLSDPNVASKEWIVRQYDHEVQSTSCVKPLVGVHGAGPGDASVCAPVLGRTKGFAVGLGINPSYSDLDPYHMACAAIDEALRNVVAVGGDPEQTSILDNFSWGNTSKPDRLGALVRASQGCYDAAMALGTPFISGKDSLNNEYATSDGTIVIPHTLLVSALAVVEDVRRSVTMDAKRTGSKLFLIGSTANELGGSAYLRAHGRRGNGPPRLDLGHARKILHAMHHAITTGHVLSCHDCSEGGLAVAAAEMGFAGDIGMSIDLAKVAAEDGMTDAETLFSESLTRFLVEVAPDKADAFVSDFDDLPCVAIGETVETPMFRVTGRKGALVLEEPLDELRDLFRSGLTRHLEGDDHGTA